MTRTGAAPGERCVRAACLMDENTGLESFYIVASALTSEYGADSHLVSRLKVTCEPMSHYAMPENWAGYRQPFMPPSMRPPPPPVLSPHVPVRSSRAATSFGAAFAVTAAVLAAATIATRLRRRSRGGAGEPEEAVELLVTHHKPPAAVDAADEALSDDFDVFISYRRIDYRLADGSP